MWRIRAPDNSRKHWSTKWRKQEYRHQFKTIWNLLKRAQLRRYEPNHVSLVFFFLQRICFSVFEIATTLLSTAVWSNLFSHARHNIRHDIIWTNADSKWRNTNTNFRGTAVRFSKCVFLYLAEMRKFTLRCSVYGVDWISAYAVIFATPSTSD